MHANVSRLRIVVLNIEGYKADFKTLQYTDGVYGRLV
jgi:hypothetical protein